MASRVPRAAAMATIPMFSIDEYASMRLKSVCTTSRSAATASVSRPVTIRPTRMKPGPSVMSTMDLTRSSA